MKISLSAVLFGLLLFTPAFAQEPAAAPPRPERVLSDGRSSLPEISPSTSPELWLYTQEVRRHEDPQQAVRRKAEARADQRMNRLATMKWFGQSNSRPHAAATPFMDEYSPIWNGNGVHPFSWNGVANPTRTVYVERYFQR